MSIGTRVQFVTFSKHVVCVGALVGFGFIEKLFTGMVSHVLDLQESYC
jgi:hypothetical protein